MPKSIAVADFAAKLGLLAKRLSWSRGKLAQEIGVDKSLVTRWLAGSSRPSDHSFMRLNAAASRVLSELTAADWDLPVDQFAARLGLVAPAVPREEPEQARATISGLRHPAKVEWGMPYLGLWAGFHQSVSYPEVPVLCVARFAIDELGLRFSWSNGNRGGEGPALATHAYIHCVMELSPLHDKLVMFIFNAVADPQAAIIDGVMCAAGINGRPGSGSLLLFHIGDEAEVTPDFAALSAVCGEFGERTAREAGRTGDPFAVAREIAPTEVLRLVCARGGVQREDHADQHGARAPAQQSRGTGRVILDSLPAHASLRAARSGLRRVLGIEQAPEVRPVIPGTIDILTDWQLYNT